MSVTISSLSDEVPMSYVRDLWKKIQEMLALNDDTTKGYERLVLL